MAFGACVCDVDKRMRVPAYVGAYGCGAGASNVWLLEYALYAIFDRIQIVLRHRREIEGEFVPQCIYACKRMQDTESASRRQLYVL